MKKIILSMMAAALFAACSKSNQQAPGGQPQVAAMLTATNRSVSMNTVSSDSLKLTSAIAQVVSVKFEAKAKDSEIEYRSSEQRAIDLLSATPITGNINIPAGVYDEVELKNQLAPASGKPALEFTADLTSGGSIIPVRFISSENMEVKGEKNNITIDPGTGMNISTLIDMSKVMRGISASDLAGATRVNGEILINATTNAGLYRKIADNLRSLEDECEVHRH